LVPQARHGASPFSGVKSLSWSMNLCWLEQVQSRGFDEALLLNERGNISECTSANVFVAQGNRVLTPPLSSGCLPGVTRDLLLHELQVPGIRVEEGDLAPADLRSADEVFVTSTTRNLLPVTSIDGEELTCRGDAHIRLAAAFAGYVDSYVKSAAPATEG
jgi:branched-chain amino acid aminotransferase